MTTIRDEILAAMKMLSEQTDTVVVGYNVCNAGGAGGGSFKDFPEDRRWEMPLCENLVLGASIGISLDGKIPIVWFERADFLFCAMDALVNHVNYLSQLSQGQHNPGIIIRVCVGNSKAPLFTGPTHTQNPYEALWRLVPNISVHLIQKAKPIEAFYRWALDGAHKGKSTIIIEQKDLYNEP